MDWVAGAGECLMPGLLLSGCESLEKLTRVHVVFEGLAAIDEDDGDLVVILPAQFRVGIDIDLAPVEVGLGLQVGEGFGDDFTEVASLAGIDDYLVHRAILNGGLGSGRTESRRGSG